MTTEDRRPRTEDLLRALAVIAEPPTARTSQLARLLDFPGVLDESEYTDLFVLQLSPYASVYAGVEGAIGGETRERVAGFWSVIGVLPPVEADHLSALLGLYAGLAERERLIEDDRGRSALGRARAAFLWEHLLSWLGPYLRKVESIATEPYAAWARLLKSTLWSEAVASPSAGPLPLHLRAATGLPSTDASLDDWCGALLAPVRSGIVLTRTDLARAARDLGLGLRAGERRYTLRTLFAQDAPAISAWLADEAEVSAAAFEEDEIVLGPVARFWAERARHTSVALRHSRDGTA